MKSSDPASASPRGSEVRGTLRFVVLASGRGSNFGALARALEGGGRGASIAALVTDRPGAPCAELAREFGIPVLALPAKGLGRTDYDRLLAERVAAFDPDWIFLLGWMRLLSMAFLARFPGRVVNLHPALPGAFPGTEAIARAWEAARRGEIAGTGVMLHLVPDEGVDAGPPLAIEEVPIDTSEDLASLEEKIHAAEHRLVVDLASRLARGQSPAIPAPRGAEGA